MAKRKVEQKQFEQTIVQSDDATNEPRTTLSLSLTVSDKKALKMMTAEKGTTIAAIIRGWIEEHMKRRSYKWRISMRPFLKLQS